MKDFLCLFLGCIFVLISLNLPVLSQTTEAQTPERKRPKTKKFGSSLKRTPQENLNPSKINEGEKNDSDDETIKIETNLVVFDFLVLNSKGLSVSGLKKEDFNITEDEQPQEIQTFTMGDDANVPRSIVLIIDYSGSQLPYIERSVEAAKQLVDKLRPNDLMAIATDDIDLLVDYTNDKKTLKNKLDSLKNGAKNHRSLGKSKQFSSLYAVLNEMFNEKDVRPIVIFQTDGDQFLFLKGEFGPLIYFSSHAEPTNFSLNDLLTMTDKSRASIYTVVPGPKLLGLSPEEKKVRLEKERELVFKAFGINPNRGFTPSKEQLEMRRKIEELTKIYYPNGMPDTQEVLAGLSKYTGGWLDFLEDPNQADEIYSRILNQIDSRYIISFSPTNETKDGKLRVVKVSVKNHPEYTVWGRKTYLAPMTN